MPKQDFFNDPQNEGKPQEEGEEEKVKIGEAEYTQEELDKLISLGKTATDLEAKWNTKIDSLLPEYTKSRQALKSTTEELENAKKKLEDFEKKATEAPSELTQDQINLAREQARKLGIVTQSDLETWYQSRRQAESLLEECDTLTEEIKGDDGRPKFNTEEILAHMQETGIRNPLKAYKDKYENELDKWKESELAKAKGQGMVTTEAGGGEKQPKEVRPNKENLEALIKEQLFGSHE